MISWPSISETMQKVHRAPDVDDYTERHLLPHDSTLQHALENSTTHGLPVIAVSPSQGKFLSLLTSLAGAKNVLEIGTLGGYSSIWLARSVRENGGRVTSIELQRARRDVAIENLKHAGVQVPDEVEVLLGAALDVLPQLEEEIKAGTREPFDFALIDADWDNHWNYFDWAVKLSRGKGSAVYVDNTVRALLEEGVLAGENENKARVDMIERVGKDARVTGVVVQTIGGKDYDGFLLALVK